MRHLPADNHSIAKLGGLDDFEDGVGIEMDCILNSGMFMRSNGDLVCWDDAGCNVKVQVFDSQLDYATDVYLGQPYNSIRNSLKNGLTPCRECNSCVAMNTAQPFSEFPLTEKILSYLQVESSFACQLACPNCYPGVKRKDVLARGSGGHLTLKPAAFRKIVGDLVAGGIDIKLIEFQGHGEPLVNPHIWQMCSYAYQITPSTEIRIITHANFDFREHMRDSGVSEMIFAIDGVDQASYEPYRINGEYDTAFEFMRQFCAEPSTVRQLKTIWKYVLFEHNSTIQQLEKLTTEAEKANVDEVRLVVTMMGPSSTRFFKMLCDIWQVSSASERAKDVFSRMQGLINVRDLSVAAHELVGYSPFPDAMIRTSAGKTNYTLMCYTALSESLDANLPVVISKARRSAKDPAAMRSADDAAVSFATKLWRLYESRTEMLIPAHYEMACRVMALLSWLSFEAQKEVALKLNCFVSKSHLTSVSKTYFLLPIHDVILKGKDHYLAVADDPAFLLIPNDLKICSGQVKFSFDLDVLDGDLDTGSIYFDIGNGFSENNRVGVEAKDLRCGSVTFRIPNNTSAIRFDPRASPGEFRLSGVRTDPAGIATPESMRHQSASLLDAAEAVAQKIEVSMANIKVNTIDDAERLAKLAAFLLNLERTIR